MIGMGKQKKEVFGEWNLAADRTEEYSNRSTANVIPNKKMKKTYMTQSS